jgi:hypothetical protein
MVSESGIRSGHQSTLRVTVQADGYERLEHDVVLWPDAAWPSLELALIRKRGDIAEENAPTEGRLPPGFVGPGLVSWWWRASEPDGANTKVYCGVPVTAGCLAGDVAAVDGAGRFFLRGPWREYPLCLQRPGLPPAWFWPVQDRADTHVPVPTGALSGRVTGLPQEAFARCHAVLFREWLPRRSVRVRPDGTFEARDVAAGKYWVRVGDDDFDRVRAKLEKQLGLEDHQGEARASLGALEIRVRAGEDMSGVEVAAD